MIMAKLALLDLLKVFILGIVLMAGFVSPSWVQANEIPSKTPSDFVQSFDSFKSRLDAYVTRVASDSSIRQYVDVLYKFFAFLVFFMFVMDFMGNGYSQERMIMTVLLIAGTKVLMDHYMDLTRIVWGVAEGLAMSFQTLAINNSHNNALVDYFTALLDHIEFNSHWWEIFDNARLMLWGIVFTLLAFVFIMAATFATTWALWGYAVAKVIGFIFVPFIMLESTRGFFLGWVRFFMGFCVYYVLARINLVILFLVTSAFLGLGVGGPPYNLPGTGPVYTISPLGNEHYALLLLMLMGILSMFSIGSFSAAIVGGAAGAPSVRRLLPRMGSR